MSRRWLPWLAPSLGLTVLLGYALVHWSGVDLARVAGRFGDLRIEGFATLTGLVALTTWLSAVRWRLIASRTGISQTPGRAVAFALTALGVGVGQIMPVQIAAALSRSLGGRLFGDQRPLRTAITTLYEQSFDLGLMMLLASASVASLAVHSMALWPIDAALAICAALLLARSVQSLFKFAPSAPGRLGNLLATVQRSRLLEPEVLSQLIALTTARFVVLAMMAWATSWCARLEVSPLALAAALPLVTLVTAVPITPAGLGVNEWTFAAVLTALGTPMEVAAEWALINRVLVTGASLIVGAIGVAIGLRATSSTPVTARLPVHAPPRSD